MAVETITVGDGNSEFKKYSYKVYDSSGTFIKVYEPNTVKSDPRFNSQQNGGLGQLVIDLNLPFDDFDEGDSVDYMNIVETYEIDDESPTGRLIHKGFVSQYEPYFRGSDQGVRLTVLGLVSRLKFDYFKNGASFTVSYAGATDIADIFKDIIDQYQSVTGDTLINYTTNINTTGVTPNLDIVDKTWFDALQLVLSFAPQGWYWRVDPDGEVVLYPPQTAAAHKLTIEDDLESASIKKTTERLINSVQVRYAGAATYDDSDATSITAYEKRQKIISDEDILDAASAQARAENEVDNNKDPINQTRLTLNKRYDFESIKPGHTCKVLNLKKGSTTFSANMLISGFSYSPNFMTLQIEDQEQNFGKTLQAFIDIQE